MELFSPKFITTVVCTVVLGSSVQHLAAYFVLITNGSKLLSQNEVYVSHSEVPKELSLNSIQVLLREKLPAYLCFVVICLS